MASATSPTCFMAVGLLCLGVVGAACGLRLNAGHLRWGLEESVAPGAPETAVKRDRQAGCKQES